MNDAGGIWYGGLFIVFVVVLEFFGFILTAVGVTLAIAYLYRPSLLEQFNSGKFDKGLNKEEIENRAEWLNRTRNFLLGTSGGEALLSLVCLIMLISFPFLPFSN